MSNGAQRGRKEGWGAPQGSPAAGLPPVTLSPGPHLLVTCGPHPLAPSPLPTVPSPLSSPHRGLAESGSGVAWDESHHCGLLAGVVPEHSQTCRRNLEVMHSVVRAAAETVSACQKTFAGMRWNCSSIQRAPSFGPDLLKGKGGSPRVLTSSSGAPRAVR